MGEPLPKHILDTAVDPAAIVEQSFPLTRRGFDRDQVQDYLAAIAASLEDAQQREADMRSRLGKAIRRAESAEQQVRDHANAQLGEDVTSVLDAAQVTAEQRLTAAQRSAEQLLENAKTDADQIRLEAQRVLDDKRHEARIAAHDVVAVGHKKADEILVQARRDAHVVKLDAANRLQQALERADALVSEADEARGHILEDLERRRRQARAQVERLRVGRDRLLRSYDVVRRTLDETTTELKGSLKEAKVRADSAARAIATEPIATRAQLEDELRDAKLIGAFKPAEPTSNSGSALNTPELNTPELSTPELSTPELRSPALPRPLNEQANVVDLRTTAAEPHSVTPLLEQALVVQALTPNKRGATTPRTGPKAPAAAPRLDPSPPDAASAHLDPIAAMMQAVEAKHGPSPEQSSPGPVDPSEEPLDAELAQLEDDDLDVVELSDEIEEVQALPLTPAASYVGIEAQRDAVIADAAKELETHLQRALAEEQNELLAGLRQASDRELMSLVGDVDHQVNRYIVAINEVAAVTYGAGAALIDAEAIEGHLPAGAVEELLATDLVLPIRERLESLDRVDNKMPDTHVDHVRAVYLQRTTDHLGFAASRLANLLCVAGVCDALPDEAGVPWQRTDATDTGAALSHRK